MEKRAHKRRHHVLRFFFLLILFLLAIAASWTFWVYRQIRWYADRDMAAPADAIAVFGAAEYAGKPSPVFRARLDHAFSLYRRGIAPLIITLGGPGGDRYTEGAVGREYLVGKGVPEQDIIAETESRSTEDSAARIAVIARTNQIQRLVIVSDATHLFRIHAIASSDGLSVLTSPRPRVEVEGGADEFSPIEHEIVSYTLWRLRLRPPLR